MASDHTRPNDATRDAEVRASGAPHDAGRGPTADEEQAAEAAGVSPGTEAHYEEMRDKGAHQQGEGRIG